MGREAFDRAGRTLQALAFLGSTKAGEVMRMKDYEILMIVLTVIGLLLTAFSLGLLIG